MEQKTQKWFNDRKGKITGSAVGGILDLSPHTSSREIMRRMVREYHGAPSEFEGNIATEYGNRYEAEAIREYTENTGIEVQPVGFIVHPEIEWLGASPDGLIGDNGLIEVKCPYSLRNGGDFKSIDDQPYYYAQIQIQLYCTGRKACEFIQWSPHSFKVEEVLFSQRWINNNLPKLEAFYNDYLEAIKSPEIYLNDKRTKIDIKIDDYFDVCKKLKELEEKKKTVLADIVEACGGKDSEINGHKLTKVTKAGAVSYAKAIKDLLPDADLSAYQGKPTEYWLLK